MKDGILSDHLNSGRLKLPYVKAKAGKPYPSLSIKPLIEGNDRFAYDSRDETFRFLKQTIIYSSDSRWLIDWVRKMERGAMVNQDTLMVYNNTEFANLPGCFHWKVSWIAAE